MHQRPKGASKRAGKRGYSTTLTWDRIAALVVFIMFLMVGAMLCIIVEDELAISGADWKADKTGKMSLRDGSNQGNMGREAAAAAAAAAARPISTVPKQPPSPLVAAETSRASVEINPYAAPDGTTFHRIPRPALYRPNISLAEPFLDGCLDHIPESARTRQHMVPPPSGRTSLVCCKTTMGPMSIGISYIL